MSRPTTIFIDKSALKHNQTVAKRYAPNSLQLCCVKADAYGHGLVKTAISLEPNADALGVAAIEEAIVLRHAGIQCPILLMEGLFSKSECALVEQYKLWLVVHNEQQLQYLSALNKSVSHRIWLKIDTGMHRLGFAPEQAKTALNQIKQQLPNANIIHMTHLACADETDSPTTEQQLALFKSILPSSEPVIASAANSAAVIAFSHAHYQWVRPGLMIYGISPFSNEHASQKQLKAVMQFHSKVIAVRSVKKGDAVGYSHHWRAKKETTIATVAAGYGDGYPRNVGDNTPILVNEQQLATVVGRVSMDMLTVDVGDVPNVIVGSPVELWGNNVTVNQVAKSCNMSPYELVTSMPTRLTKR